MKVGQLHNCSNDLQRQILLVIESYWIVFLEFQHGNVDSHTSFCCFSLITLYTMFLLSPLPQTAEGCAMDTLRNSWKVFAHWKVISYYYTEDKTKMVQLQKGYRSEDQLSGFIDRVETFKT